MTRAASPRLEGYAVVVAVGLVAALALRRPELAVLASPFALVLGLGLRLGRGPRIHASLELETDRVVEGEPFLGRGTGGDQVDRLELLSPFPKASRSSTDGRVRVQARRETSARPGLLRCLRWGLTTSAI
jgi:hypothetical protein